MIGIYAAVFAGALWLAVKKNSCRKGGLVVMAGTLAAAALWLAQQAGAGEILTEVIRAEKGEKQQEVTLAVQTETESGQVFLQVSPQEYSREELEQLCQEMWEKLETEIPAENSSLAYVTAPLYFPERVEGYPFLLTWQTQDTKMLTARGIPGEEIPAEGSLVQVQASITDREGLLKEEKTFYVRLFPEEGPEGFWKRLEALLKKQEEKSRDAKAYTLPRTFEGKELAFSLQKSDRSALLFLLALAGGGAVAAGERQEQEKRKKKRLLELEREYPGMVSRLTMLVDAGMGITAALKRIAGDYGKRKQETKMPLYEELLVACREIESGISEREAYKNMGVRCGLPCMIRFTALLAQYGKSGAGGLKDALREETRQALSERRELARRRGEEAGTKLLLPMTLMLVLVMILIMIPAFTSFGI